MLRNRQIGFIFQSFNLIPRTSALANVELPLVYAGCRAAGAPRAGARRRSRSSGSSDASDHRPNQLSGGQQQRVAVARALVTSPALLLADEPTGNLDSASTTDVLGLFDRLHEAGRTIVLITHDDEVAARAERVVVVTDGRLRDARAGVPAGERRRDRPLRGARADRQPPAVAADDARDHHRHRRGHPADGAGQRGVAVYIQSQIAGLGANSITVLPRQPPRDRGHRRTRR